MLVTDNGSHFSNRIMRDLARRTNFEHTFTVAYSPWTNGAGERINSEILKTMKALMSQYQLHESEWPKLLPHVMYAINNRPLPSRENLTANQIFLAKNPEKEDLFEPETFPLLNKETGELSQPNGATLRSLVENLQQEVERKVSRTHEYVRLQREYKNAQANKKRFPRVQFGIGNWVLISTAGTPRANLSKIKKDWGGPVQVVDIVSDNVYMVEDLFQKRSCVHAARMWFYDGTDFVPTEEMRELFQGDWGLLEVSELTDLRYHGKTYEVETHWLGFEEPTWEPIENLHQFIPEMVQEFLEKGISSKKRTSYLRAQRQLAKTAKETHSANRLRITTAPQDSTPRTVNWHQEEDEILKACIAKYGVGRFEKIHQALHLPFRTRAQLCQRTKTLLGVQSLQTFTRIHLKVDRVAKDNRRKYGTDYYVNTSGIPLTTLQREAQWEENFQKYELSPEEIAHIRVPYYRRPEDPEHLKLKMAEDIEELGQDEEECLRDAQREEQRTKKSEEYYRQHFLPLVTKILNEKPEWGYKKFGFPQGKTVSLGLYKEKGRTILSAVDTSGEFDPFDLASGKQTIERQGSVKPVEPNTLKTSFYPERVIFIFTCSILAQCNRTKEENELQSLGNDVQHTWQKSVVVFSVPRRSDTKATGYY